MKNYAGTKTIQAEPMNLGNYNNYRGWTIPENEDPKREGYLVAYEDGYRSWSPKETFEKSYKDCQGLTFGIALELAKQGRKIAREEWNGKGMFVVFQKGYPQGIHCNKQTADAWGLNEGDLFKVEPYLQIQMVNGSHAMWVPSINDCLSEDWVIVE